MSKHLYIVNKNAYMNIRHNAISMNGGDCKSDLAITVTTCPISMEDSKFIETFPEKYTNCDVAKLNEIHKKYKLNPAVNKDSLQMKIKSIIIDYVKKMPSFELKCSESSDLDTMIDFLNKVKDYFIKDEVKKYTNNLYHSLLPITEIFICPENKRVIVELYKFLQYDLYSKPESVLNLMRSVNDFVTNHITKNIEELAHLEKQIIICEHPKKKESLIKKEEESKKYNILLNEILDMDINHIDIDKIIKSILGKLDDSKQKKELLSKFLSSTNDANYITLIFYLYVYLYKKNEYINYGVNKKIESDKKSNEGGNDCELATMNYVKSLHSEKKENNTIIYHNIIVKSECNNQQIKELDVCAFTLDCDNMVQSIKIYESKRNPVMGITGLKKYDLTKYENDTLFLKKDDIVVGKIKGDLLNHEVNNSTVTSFFDTIVKSIQNNEKYYILSPNLAGDLHLICEELSFYEEPYTVQRVIDHLIKKKEGVSFSSNTDLELDRRIDIILHRIRNPKYIMLKKENIIDAINDPRVLIL